MAVSNAIWPPASCRRGLLERCPAIEDRDGVGAIGEVHVLGGSARNRVRRTGRSIPGIQKQRHDVVPARKSAIPA